MVSVDFAEIEVLQREGRWEQATQAMIDAMAGRIGASILTNLLVMKHDDLVAKAQTSGSLA